MCTLIAFHGVWEDAPLVVATNRDEAYDRPSSPPRWLQGDPAVLAPLDDRVGGTWMGANARGLWVGLTNRRSGSDDRALRSRGLLCRELLAAESATAAAEVLESLKERYNPFHVVLADANRMLLVEYEAGHARTRRLPPGCHVVTNRPFDQTADEPKARRAVRQLSRLGLWPVARGSDSPADLETRLASLLADHGEEGRDAICIHGGRYGTKSAGVWCVSPPDSPGGTAHIALSYADGPPCSTGFSPVVDGVQAPG